MAEVLGSWKEIAAYLGKGVRTVQRWEAELGLPVHRPVKARKGIVIAFPEELRNWSAHRPVQPDATATQERSRRTGELAASVVQRTLEIGQLAQKLSLQCKAILEQAGRAKRFPPPPRRRNHPYG